MSGILSVFLLYMVLVASAQHIHEDVGEYGKWNTWRKAVCEKNDHEMNKELDACFKLEHKNVQDAMEECGKKADPETEGKAIPFVEAACSNTALFLKFDDCFEEYEANSAFREQMELTPEIEACYDKVLKKYKIGDLRTILKDWPLSDKSR